MEKSKKNVTAGIIIIGDEILKGQVVDTNTIFLTKKLYDLGVQVKKISVLPDEVGILLKSSNNFQKKFLDQLD